MKSVRVLLFDVVGTVVDWRGGLISKLGQWGAEQGVTADWPGVVDAWRAASPPQWAQVNAGQRPWANFDELLHESLESIAPKFGLSNLNEMDLHDMVTFWEELPPWRDTIPGLERLRREYVISPLSNCHVASLVRLAKVSGLPWDAVLGVDLFKHYKPAPETYLGAAALLGYQPSEVMLVACHPSDLVAAEASGLRTGYVHRPLEYGAGRIVEATPEMGRFDVMADNLETFAGLLSC